MFPSIPEKVVHFFGLIPPTFTERSGKVGKAVFPNVVKNDRNPNNRRIHLVSELKTDSSARTERTLLQKRSCHLTV